MLAGIGLTPWFPTTQGQRSAGALDVAPGAAAAYSLRKLRSVYSGAAIRVRESGGDAEADIGFDSNGNLDTAALAAHVGSNDGFVVTWYDQSGNGSDATQNTVAEQPQIVSNGSTITVNGKPAVSFDGSDDFLTAGTGFATTDGYFLTTVSSNDIIADENAIYGIAALAVSADDRFFLAYGGFSGSNNAAQSFLVTNGSSSETSTLDGTIAAGSQNLLTATLLSGGSELFYNGMGQGNSNTTADPNDIPATAELRLGQRFGGSFTADLNGKIQEAIFYTSDQSGKRTQIESDINNYYEVF